MTVPAFAMHDLGWHAFQQLCHTVLREILGQEVLSFLDGNDGGRDGAFAGTWTASPAGDLQGQFVAQCKHTSRAGTTIGLGDLSDELQKVERLVRSGRCDVYLLMTNAGITGKSERVITDALKARGVKHTLILNSTWLNQTIAASSRLRRLVPRLYGLGDLTQILDERAYRQARAVLDAMRTDLDKLVLTQTYERAGTALAGGGFVLLVGAPATGKTTIAAQLALGAADEFDTAVVKIESAAEIRDRWNPDERQFFWLDDAFGATQIDRSLTRDWTAAAPRIRAAIAAGSMFVLTSRDYIFRAAFNFLKPGSFPLLNEAQVVVDVADLRPGERRQILYNHLRHGRQTDEFVQMLLPHLEAAATHPGFTPELARRLSEPTFTGRVAPQVASSIDAFFARPTEFLKEVMAGLGSDARAALGLIFVNHDWLASPVKLRAPDQDLLVRLGSDLGQVVRSLEELRGSLVQYVVRDGEGGWVFAHPTMVDAYAELLRSPELIHHLVLGFPLDVLLREVACGDVGVQGAVIVPRGSYDVVLDRLDEPLPKGDAGWRTKERLVSFLATRCDREFIALWLARDPGRLDRLATPGLMLESDAGNEFVVRLNELGLYPEAMRKTFVSELVDYCATGIDPAVLWNERLASLMSADERANLIGRMRSELLGDLRTSIRNCADGWDSEYEPESAIQPLRDLCYHLPLLFPNDSSIFEKVDELNWLLDEWVGDQSWDEERGPRPLSASQFTSPSSSDNSLSTTRSIFDDLLDGRTVNN